ncbi:MAG: DUF4102 domain-containing protein [Desulfobulbaceae bacterium]|nr:MAG: DUF4102 domain-containing protein [Desulfobulbaceae bacterium]
MTKRIVPLTDTRIRTIKATPKAQKLFDGGGLFLLVSPTGGKLWRLKYRFGGIEKLLAIGAYPQISLADARQRREQILAMEKSRCLEMREMFNTVRRILPWPGMTLQEAAAINPSLSITNRDSACFLCSWPIILARSIILK